VSTPRVGLRPPPRPPFRFLTRPSNQHDRTFRFPVSAGDPGHPVRTSSLAAHIPNRIAIGHPSIVYPARGACAQKILIAYGKAVLVQSDGLAYGPGAERSAI
jgi:hypothetical protein